jgi:hypothetical protein
VLEEQNQDLPSTDLSARLTSGIPHFGSMKLVVVRISV